MLSRLAEVPSVEHAAVANVLPFQGGSDVLFSLEDGLGPDRHDRGAANVRRISPEYFSALHIPIHAGRSFTDQDRSSTMPVVVINRAMAQAYWPNRDPLGLHIWIGKPMGPASTEPTPRQIVGVVENIREASLAQLPEPTLYLPYSQSLSTSGGSFIVRTTRPPMTLVPDVRTVVQTLDRELPLTAVRDMPAVIASSTVDWRFRAVLLSTFGGLALAIAAIGVYGVIAYSVAQRTQEIGVRVALGARHRDVLSLVLWQGMRTTIIGLGIGLGAAFALTRLMANLLFGVSPTDPMTFTAIALLLSLVAFAACLLPARRAMRVDPVTALKQD
jgi:predicted permease